MSVDIKSFEVYLNGKAVHISGVVSLEDFLHKQDLPIKHYAVAINRAHVPRQQYAVRLLQSEDRIEIVIPVQGG